MFARAPLVSITIVMTVALARLITKSVHRAQRVRVPGDAAVPDVHDMVAVQRPTVGDDRPRFTRPQFDAMRRETHVFTDIYAELADITPRRRPDDVDLSSAQRLPGWARPRGARTRSPARNDERTAPQPVMVLSDRGRHKLFAGDLNIVGRRGAVNGGTFEIIK
jgi:hypothetical protein